MEIIKGYKKYLKAIEEQLNRTEDFINNKERCSEILRDIDEFKFLIPVIGNFSAGKSAFLNTFLGKNILKVDILPETSIATELHYDIKERIEAVDKNDNYDIYSIEEINDFNTSEKEYVYCRLFLNSEKLKSIEPMILVDMPGFNSSLEAHNIAIDSYLYFGKHFLVLNSIEDGTINSNLLKILKTIEEKNFTFCLTKTDLMIEEEINKVNEHIVETIDNRIYREEIVHNITINNPENIDKIIRSIDLEEVFTNIFNPVIRDLENGIEDDINTKINALGVDSKLNEKNIRDIEVGIEKIKDKREEMIKDTKNKFYEGRINNLIDKIGREIEDYEEELVNLILNNDSEGIQGIVVECTNNVLQNNLDVVMDEINVEIADEMTFSLKNIDSDIFGNEMVEKINETVTLGTKYLNSKLEALGKKGEKEVLKKGYKMVTGVTAVLTTVVNPLLEIAIIFLPEIISFFTQGMQEKRMKEEARKKISTGIIPKVKSKLRPELTRLIREQINRNIELISEQIEKELENKQQLLNEAIEEKERKEEEINRKINLYNEIKENIKNII